MDLKYFRERIKLEITGNLTHLEIPDETIDKIISLELQELQRYIDTPKFITCPFARVIDMKGFKCSAVTKVYRTEGYTGDSNKGAVDSNVDPMYAQLWMSYAGGGSMYNLQDYMLNFMSYNTLLQIRNTSSTDMSFIYDKKDEKLMINTSFDKPAAITIEYIPIYEKVEDVTSDYWIDILYKLSLAMTKVILGRIRTKYTSNNALWTTDGATMLQEGNEEIRALREMLQTNANLIYPVD